MIRQAEEFKAAVQAEHVQRWDVRECSICGTPIGFIFMWEQPANPTPFWDGGCACVKVSFGYRKTNWAGVAEVYNGMPVEFQEVADAIFNFEEQAV